MNIEKWIIAHFSPTGGTKKVADAIAAGSVGDQWSGVGLDYFDEGKVLFQRRN